jgi:hypothetical protein
MGWMVLASLLIFVITGYSIHVSHESCKLTRAGCKWLAIAVLSHNTTEFFYQVVIFAKTGACYNKTVLWVCETVANLF